MPWPNRAFLLFLAAAFAPVMLPCNASRAEELPATLELTDVDGTDGVVLRGSGSWRDLGWRVAPAGDVNGDGIDDIVIGAPTNNGMEYQSRPGVAYVVFGSPEPPPDRMASDLDGTDGFALLGDEKFDLAGWGVAPAGDFNGDGLGDVVIGVPHAEREFIQEGEAYVVFGSAAGFPAALSLASLDGVNGFTMRGRGSYDGLGFHVSGGGDLNGDGFDDVAIGAFANENGRSSGEVYVLFGTDEAVPSLLRPDELDGSNGFIIRGIHQEDYTIGSAFAGDFDGDGFDDLVVGAPGADPNGAKSGEAYLVYGSGDPFPPVLELAALDGSNGFALHGIHEGDGVGGVGPAGDFNGDGFADIAIGAVHADPNGERSGQSYVVFGTDALLPPVFELSALNGPNGFALNGIAPRDGAGYSPATAGDVNRDGFDDLLVGAPWADPNGGLSGQAYVVFGTDASMPSAFELSALDGSNGLTINGAKGDQAGYSAAAAGDFNADGVADWIVGAPNTGISGQGAAYVLFGRPAVLPIAIDVRPWSPRNVINPFGRGVVAVALLGSAVFDVSEVEIGSLAFGPVGAPASARPRPRLRDVDKDGIGDLVAYFPVDETGIAMGDTEACLIGEMLDRTPIEGCDAISTVPSCGSGFELALVLPPLLWWRRLRPHAEGAPPAG